MTPPIIFFIEGEIFFPLAFPCLKSFKFDPIKDKMFLPKRFINDVNLGKCELLAFDSSGAEYKVIHIENLGLKFALRQTQWDEEERGDKRRRKTIRKRERQRG